MAFNINAQVILTGPKNIKNVANTIKQQLGSVNVGVNLQVPRAAQGQLKALNSQMASATTNSKNLSKSSAKAAQSINNVGRAASKSVSAMEALGKEAGRTFQRFAAAGLLTATFFKLTGAISNAVPKALEFERQMVRIQQVTGKTQAQLSGFKGSVDELSKSLGVDANQLAEVAVVFAQTGQTVKQVEASLRAVARASLAPTFGDMEQTAEGLIASLAQFNIEASKSEAVLGAINRVSKKFAVESQDIISAIRRAGGVFSVAAGQMESPIESLNQLIAIFTSVRATTRESADTIATGLRTIFTRIQRPRTIEFLRQLGISLTDAEGNFVGLFKSFEILSKELDGILKRGDTLALAKITEELGGVRQVGKLIPAIKNFNKAKSAYLEAQKGAAEGLTKDVAIGLNPLIKQFEKLQARFSAFIRTVTESTTFQTFAKSAIGLANAFLKVGETLEPLLPALTSLAAIKIAKGAGGFFSGFFGSFKSGGGIGGAGSALGGAVTGGGGQQQQASRQALVNAVSGNTGAIQSNTGAVNALLTPLNSLLSPINSLVQSINSLNSTMSAARLTSGIAAGRTGPGGTISRRRGRGFSAGGRVGYQAGGPVPNKFAGLFLRDNPDGVLSFNQINRNEQRTADLTGAFKGTKLDVIGPSGKGRPGKGNSASLALAFQRSQGKKGRLPVPATIASQVLGTGSAKKFPYTLMARSLTEKTNRGIYNSIIKGVTGGIDEGGNVAAKETGASDFREIDQKFLKAINIDNIAGNMFEGVLGRIGLPFDTSRNANETFDFPAGVGAIGRKFGISDAKAIGDAKLTFNKGALESFDGKVRNFLAEEAVRRTEVAIKSKKTSQVGSAGGISSGQLPALLTPGEAVISPEAVARIGADNADKFNATGDPKFIQGLSARDYSIVPGIGNTDSVAADLTSGSFVITKDSAEGLPSGTKFRRKMNRGGPVGFQHRDLQRRSAGGGAKLKFTESQAGTGGIDSLNKAAANAGDQVSGFAGGVGSITQGLFGATFAIQGLSASFQQIQQEGASLGGVLNTAVNAMLLFSSVGGIGGLKNTFGKLAAGGKSLVSGRTFEKLGTKLRSTSKGIGRAGARGIGPFRGGGRVATGVSKVAGRSAKAFGSSLIKHAPKFGKLAAGGLATVAVGLVADPLQNAIGDAFAGKREEIAPGIVGRRGASQTGAGAIAAGGGALKGAALGATLGSVIPGIGTAVGGMIGAIGGAITGFFGGKSQQETFEIFDRLNKAIAAAIPSLQGLANATTFSAQKVRIANTNVVQALDKLQPALENQAASRGIGGTLSSLFGGTESAGSKASRKAANAEVSLATITDDFIQSVNSAFQQTAALATQEIASIDVSALEELSTSGLDFTNVADIDLSGVAESAANMLSSISGADFSTMAAQVDIMTGKTSSFVEALKSAGGSLSAGSDLVKLYNNTVQTNLLVAVRDQINAAKDLEDSAGEAQARKAFAVFDELGDKLGEASPKEISDAFDKLGISSSEIRHEIREQIKQEQLRQQQIIKENAALAAANERMKEVTRSIDALSAGLDKFVNIADGGIARFDAFIGEFQQGFERAFSTDAKVLTPERINPFENIDAASTDEIDRAFTRIAANIGRENVGAIEGLKETTVAARELPIALKGAVQSLTAGGEGQFKSPEEAISKIFEALGEQGIGDLPDVVRANLEKGIRAQFGKRQGAAGGTVALEELVSEEGEVVAAISGLADKVKESIGSFTNSLNAFESAIIRAANIEIELANKRRDAELKVIDIQQRLGEITGADKGKSPFEVASERFEARQQTVSGSQDVSASGLLQRRGMLEARSRAIRSTIGIGADVRPEDAAAGVASDVQRDLIKQLAQVESALGGTKQALDELANDTTRLASINETLKDIERDKMSAQDRLFSIQQELANAIESGDFQKVKELESDLATPILALQKAQQGQALSTTENAALAKNIDLLADLGLVKRDEADELKTRSLQGFLGGETFGKFFGKLAPFLKSEGGLGRGVTAETEEEGKLKDEARRIAGEQQLAVTGSLAAAEREVVDLQKRYNEELNKASEALKRAGAELLKFRGDAEQIAGVGDGGPPPNVPLNAPPPDFGGGGAVGGGIAGGAAAAFARTGIGEIAEFDPPPGVKKFDPGPQPRRPGEGNLGPQLRQFDLGPQPRRPGGDENFNVPLQGDLGAAAGRFEAFGGQIMGAAEMLAKISDGINLNAQLGPLEVIINSNNLGGQLENIIKVAALEQLQAQMPNIIEQTTNAVKSQVS